MANLIDKQTVEADAVKLVLSTRDHFIKLRENAGLNKLWTEFELSYYNQAPDYYNGQARVRIPALHQAVERIVPKMDKVIFPPDGVFLALDAKDPDNEVEAQAADVATALITQQFKDVRAREKLISVYRSLAIYGTIFLKTYWHHEEKERFIRNTDGKREKAYATVIDNPDFYNIDIRDFYADPKDENLQGSVVERIVMDYNTLWKQRERIEDGETIGIYKNVEEVKGLFLKTNLDADRQESDEAKGMAQHEYGPHENKVQVYEYWGDVPKYFFTRSIEDMESLEMIEDCIIVVATASENSTSTGQSGSGVCLRMTDNIFDHNEKPYLRGRYIKVDGKLYGLGVMHVTTSLECELNTLRNQLMDMRTFMLRNKWLKERNAEISNTQLNDLSNTIIDTNDIAGLQALRPPDFSASAISNEQNIKQDIYDATGATPFLSGTPTGGSLDRTAAGIATMVQGGLERFELVVTLFEEEILKSLIEKFWQLNQQFLPEGRDVKITGQPLMKVSPEEIPYNFELNFLGLRELGEKEFKINALNILLQNLSPFIPLGLDPIPVVMKFFKLTGMGDLAKEVDKRPDTQLEYTPEGEVQLLQMGKKVRVDLNDNHDNYIQAYVQLLQQPNLADNVVANTKEALGQRLLAKQMLSEVIKQLGQPKPQEEKSEDSYGE